MWPFKKKVHKVRSFPISIYNLGDQVDNITDLVELTASEYLVMNRNFKNQHIYKVPPVKFIDKSWNMMIGTVNGQIYKLSPYLELSNKQEANKIAIDTLSFCTGKLGKPTEQRTGLFIWDTIDGNVILQTADAADGFAINLFITSNAARNFTRI